VNDAAGSRRVGVIAGPTASGKSTLAEKLVGPCNAEIVSADALQVYRGLDVGTAKPSCAARQKFHYHGVDILPADGGCTAGMFAEFAQTAIATIHGRERLPLLVGGTGFYVDAALGRLEALPPSLPAWRRALEVVAERRGLETTHAWLHRLDPDRAAAIEPRDRQRVVRALEIVMRMGRSVAEVSAPALRATDAEVVFVGLRWPREELYRRIERRVDQMLAAGWLNEVQRLLAAGLRPTHRAMQAIGYRDLCAVAAGEITVEAARDQIARDTRRYAKRQITYFQRWPVHWIDLEIGESPDLPAVVEAAQGELTGRQGLARSESATDRVRAT
jgi:tRNA dimethylallyltransferase